jgi:phosphatidylserine synthase
VSLKNVSPVTFVNHPVEAWRAESAECQRGVPVGSLYIPLFIRSGDEFDGIPIICSYIYYLTVFIYLTVFQYWYLARRTKFCIKIISFFAFYLIFSQLLIKILESFNSPQIILFLITLLLNNFIRNCIHFPKKVIASMVWRLKMETSLLSTV